MIVRSLRRAAAVFGVAIAATAVFAVATPSSASADALRPLNVSLWCFQGGVPYGYSVNTGSGWYTPAASGDATLVNGTKTFHLLIPTTAASLAVNTYCNGIQNTLWEGYTYGITPGTSTVNAGGYCNTYPYSIGYGITYMLTYCPLSSITYS
jgi:hypothetical protein